MTAEERQALDEAVLDYLWEHTLTTAVDLATWKKKGLKTRSVGELYATHPDLTVRQARASLNRLRDAGKVRFKKGGPDSSWWELTKAEEERREAEEDGEDDDDV